MDHHVLADSLERTMSWKELIICSKINFVISSYFEIAPFTYTEVVLTFLWLILSTDLHNVLIHSDNNEMFTIYYNE